MSTKYSVFVVEDNPSYRDLIINYLSSKDELEIEAFDNGTQCLEALVNSPDIILLDYHLDGNDPNERNGLEIFKEIKLKIENPKVIVLTGESSPEIVNEIDSEGALGYFYKDPAALEDLMDMVVETLDL